MSSIKEELARHNVSNAKKMYDRSCRLQEQYARQGLHAQANLHAGHQDRDYVRYLEALANYNNERGK